MNFPRASGRRTVAVRSILPSAAVGGGISRAALSIALPSPEELCGRHPPHDPLISPVNVIKEYQAWAPPASSGLNSLGRLPIHETAASGPGGGTRLAPGAADSLSVTMGNTPL